MLLCCMKGALTQHLEVTGHLQNEQQNKGGQNSAVSCMLAATIEDLEDEVHLKSAVVFLYRYALMFPLAFLKSIMHFHSQLF